MPVALGAGAGQGEVRQEEREKGLSVRTEVGLGGVHVNGRWALVTVHPQAHAPMSGEVSIQYGLDPTQLMRLTTGFAATPGEATPAQLAVPMPMWLSEMEIDAVAVDVDGTRWRAGERLSTLGVRGGLSEGLNEQTVVIGVVGRSSAVRALEALTGAPATTGGRVIRGMDSPQERSSVAELAMWSGARRDVLIELREAVWVRLEPGSLPQMALGYDALSLLIVRADAADEMSDAQVEAVRRWTRAGGNLVVLASGAGDQWRRWLSGDGELPVSVAGSAAFVPPQEIQTLGGRAGEAAPESLTGRAITLTEAGAGGGWNIAWGLPHMMADRAGSTGWMARGPVGLGWVTVVGIEPGGAIGDSESKLASAMWLEAVLEPLKPALLAAVDHEPVRQYTPWGVTEHGPRLAALTGVLDAMTFAPPAGVGAFVAIAIAAGLLALLVGPVDYFVLGRLKARGRWWVTSLVWIGVASAIAWWGPAALRTEPTSVQRHETIDVRLGADAGAQAYWATGVTALFSAQAGRVTFEGQAPGSWWRGVSPLAGTYWGNEQPTTLATPVRVRGAGPSGPGEGHLGRTPVRMWTLRTFLDHSEGRRPLAARLTGDVDEVEVGGLSADEQVTRIVVARRERVWSSSQSREAGEIESDVRGRGQVVRWRLGEPIPGVGSPGSAEQRPGSVLEQPLQPGRPQVKLAAYSSAYGLEGAWRRSETIDRMLATGRFAVVYVETTSSEPVVRVDWEAEYTTRRVYRIVVPAGAGSGGGESSSGDRRAPSPGDRGGTQQGGAGSD